MKKILIGLSVAAMISGCTNARISKSLSSGEIGCAESEITIENETATMGGLHNWVAVCKGQKFICSYQESTGVNCKKPLEEKES